MTTRTVAKRNGATASDVVDAEVATGTGAKAAATKTGSAAAPGHATASIDRRIAELADGRGETLARVRAWIREADPAIVEEWKWDVPVWSCDGIVCTGEAYRHVVELTFARGATVPDPHGLFNASLDGKVRRAIDLRDGQSVDEAAFGALVRAAIATNRAMRAAT